MRDLTILCRAIGDDISNQMALDETPEGSRRQASDHLREEWSRQKKQTVAMQGLRGETHRVFSMGNSQGPLAKVRAGRGNR